MKIRFKINHATFFLMAVMLLFVVIPAHAGEGAGPKNIMLFIADGMVTADQAA
ncbi:MAG: hypothetical protein A4E63_02905 [Syntrophorhabdus sp. PtaU1.Bin050]|nr:MAG: hypothetical protein A4E63_02905 [Syntrophorhabdus sp. PtaU1.Bin050]